MPTVIAPLTRGWSALAGIVSVAAAVCAYWAIESRAEGVEAPSDYMLKCWSMADGLPHLSVTSLAQTSDGYIWIGTLAGLARFDGVRFKVFTPLNCPELPKSRIGRLFTNSDGLLFITTERGGGLVVLRNGVFVQLLGSGNEQDEIIACLKESPDTLVFAARSGALWRWSNDRLTAISNNREYYPISADNVCRDEHGRVWMISRGNEAGRVIRFESNQLESVALGPQFAGAQVHAIAADVTGKIWLGTSQGLADWEGGRFNRIPTPNDAETTNVMSLTACRAGGCGYRGPTIGSASIRMAVGRV